MNDPTHRLNVKRVKQKDRGSKARPRNIEGFFLRETIDEKPVQQMESEIEKMVAKRALAECAKEKPEEAIAQWPIVDLVKRRPKTGW